VSVLVIDVGTSGLRAGLVQADASVTDVHHRALPPLTPFPGLVEFDATEMAAAVLDVVGAARAAGGAVDAVGITNQRASTVLWDRQSGEPVAPAIGWQDLRTVFDCLTIAAEHGIRLAPNQSATKLAALLNTHDPDRSRDLCFGTVDTWVAWTLSRGELHVTDHSNAAVTGLLDESAQDWSDRVLDALRIPRSVLPTIVDSCGAVGEAVAIEGNPPIAAIIGDQQGSLIGQGCVEPGLTKVTFGTGGMLDTCIGPTAPASAQRHPHGTFPIVAWSRGGRLTWGAEAVMLSAGTNIEWLVEDLGVLADAAESHTVASACKDTGGVVYVPALLGLGTPRWDFGARGTLLGLTRGTGRPELVRAVLEGVAQRGADLVDAAEADTGLTIETLRVDGGMSANPTFLQALADATQRPVEVSPVLEATTLGAGLLAGLATSIWGGLDDIAGSWRPRSVIEPGAPLDRERWAAALERAAGWMPDLSSLDF
jgi:glycerol kinase